MPNNAYQRSASLERERVRTARQHGAISARSAGSKSLVDTWSWYPDDRLVILEQIKTEKGGKFIIEEDVEVIENCTVIKRLVSKQRKNGTIKRYKVF